MPLSACSIHTPSDPHLSRDSVGIAVKPCGNGFLEDKARIRAARLAVSEVQRMRPFVEHGDFWIISPNVGVESLTDESQWAAWQFHRDNGSDVDGVATFFRRSNCTSTFTASLRGLGGTSRFQVQWAHEFNTIAKTENMDASQLQSLRVELPLPKTSVLVLYSRLK